MQFDYDMALADKLLNQYLADNPNISVESIAYSGVFCSDTSELSDEDASLIGVQAGYLQWFDNMPEDILPIQECYRKDWNILKRRIVEEI